MIASRAANATVFVSILVIRTINKKKHEGKTIVILINAANGYNINLSQIHCSFYFALFSFVFLHSFPRFFSKKKHFHKKKIEMQIVFNIHTLCKI